MYLAKHGVISFGSWKKDAQGCLCQPLLPVLNYGTPAAESLACSLIMRF